MGCLLPFALYADRLPAVFGVVIVFCLVGLWGVRAARRGGRPAINFLSIPLYALVLVFVPLALWISPSWETSYGRAIWLLWCLGLFGWISGDTDEERWTLATWMRIYVICGLLVAIIGTLGANEESMIPDSLRVLPHSLTYPGGVPTNELAGALVPFFAPVVAMAVMPSRLLPMPRVNLVVVSLILVGAFMATKSRGGVLGCAVSVGCLVWFLTERRGRVVSFLLAFSAVSAVAGAWAIPAVRVFFLGGSIQGASLDTFFTGRMDIWKNSWLAINDAPISGVGLATTGGILEHVYPTRVGLEDSHQHFLQATADFGVIGGFLWACLWGGIGLILFRLIKRVRGGTLPRFVAVGLFAAFVGQFCYSLVDSVSPGWSGGLGFWFMAGLAVRMRRQVMGKEARRGWWIGAVPLVVGCVLAVCFLWKSETSGSSRKALALYKDLLAEDRTQAREIQTLDLIPNDSSVNLLWLGGLLADRLGMREERDRLWQRVLDETAEYLPLFRQQQPTSNALSAHAKSRWPDEPLACFWLSESLETEDAERSVEILREGLVLDPAAGREWIRLGEMLQNTGDSEGALLAYGNACRNGDPGANGCIRAGAISEELGNLPEALHYYRMSNWGPSRERANELDPEGERLPMVSVFWFMLALVLVAVSVLVILKRPSGNPRRSRLGNQTSSQRRPSGTR